MRAFGGLSGTPIGSRNDEHASRTLNLDNNSILVNLCVDGDERQSDADGWIFVYDVTNMLSFGSLNTMIQHKLRKIQKPPMIMVLANKSDNVSNRVLSYDDGHQFCEEQGISLFYEISAEKDRGMLSQAMIHLTSSILEDEFQRQFAEAERRRKMSILAKNKNVLIVSGVITTAVIGLYFWKKYKGDYKWQLPFELLSK